MTTFYPGPSKVYPAVADYAAQAVRLGIVSLNHRSAGFMAIVQETMRLLRLKLAIPDDYHITLVSSATECWEIVAQSLTQRTTLHPTMGAFGEKWRDYAHRIRPYTSSAEVDVLCVVQNETSNGMQVSMNQLRRWRKDCPYLIAVDAVSSMGGIALDWALADVWFASVQKCFGLPAGLAVLVYSPDALRRAEAIGEHDHYNSLLFMHENFQKFQTPYTPNGLGIYCLMRVLETVPSIAETDAQTKRRAAEWYRFLDDDLADSPFSPLVPFQDDPADNQQMVAVRSDTVIAVSGAVEAIAAVKKAALAAGITLGNGYGLWKDTTFRIANFPAISDDEIEQLRAFLRQYANAYQ
jgi:phosphoserine aminotransferase